MSIEKAVCPVCGHILMVNVPSKREIKDVYVANTIFTTWTKKPDARLLCPHCTIEVFIKYG